MCKIALAGLFPNRLKNVNYEVRVLNPLIVSAEISEDKDYIVLRGFTSGLTDLYLSIQGQPEIYDTVSHLNYGSHQSSLSPSGCMLEAMWISTLLRVLWASGSQITLFLCKLTGRLAKPWLSERDQHRFLINLGIQYKSRVNVFKVSDLVLKDSTGILTNAKRE